MASVEKILVVQTSFLGDVVLTTPLLAGIRRCLPKSHIAVLCTPRGKEILEGSPDVDEIIPLEKKRDGGRRASLWRTAGELRARKFDLALSPHKSFRTALLLFLAGIPRRIGFRQSAGWFLYHERVNRDASRHDVERNLSLLGALGVDPRASGGAPRVVPTPAAREAVGRVFRSLGINGGGMIFGVNPGSVWPTKRWTAEGYAELIVALRRKYGAEIVLFGGPDDREIVERILELSGHAGLSLVGRIGLGELGAAVERCRVFITNDSGPMHVAVGLGVPVAAIFCATTPSLGFYPYDANSLVIEKALSCRPCSAHGGRRCPLGTEDCMRMIRAEDVLAGVERLLERGGGNPQPSADSHLPQVMTV
jgi:lipopolysaccharide heptosyltransferase II